MALNYAEWVTLCGCWVDAWHKELLLQAEQVSMIGLWSFIVLVCGTLCHAGEKGNCESHLNHLTWN